MPVDQLLTGFLLHGRKYQIFGTWRSLVAHLSGGQVVGGSNPLVPTSNFNGLTHLGLTRFLVPVATL